MDVQTAGQRLRERIELFEEQPITSSAVSGFLDDLRALACLMDPTISGKHVLDVFDRERRRAKSAMERRLGLRVVDQ